MSYNVQYEKTVIKTKSCIPIKKIRLKYLTVAILLILGFACLSGKHGILLRAFFPGDSEVTFHALKELTENMKSGESFGDSVTAFCREIIENAQIPD